MALNPYYYGYDTASGTTSTTAISTYTSANTIWINDFIRQDIDKAKAKVLKRAAAKVQHQMAKAPLNVPRGTSVLAALQDSFDIWAGDVQAAIFR